MPTLFLANVENLLTDTAALAAVALVGYLFGKRTRTPQPSPVDSKLYDELSRATLIARELQLIAKRLRSDVASHQADIQTFTARLNQLEVGDTNEGWCTLSAEAEALLAPTMKLATNLSLAYDELRKQSNQLMVFAGSRTDQETGIRNRRAMEEQLGVLLSLHSQNSSRFALGIFSIKHPQGKPDRADLCALADLLEQSVRDTDIPARYSGDEFVVLMPHTSLPGATIFGQRVIKKSHAELGLVVFGGIVEVQADDTPEKLLSRADSALYSSKSDEKNWLYQHTGKAIRPCDTSWVAETTEGTSTEDECLASTIHC